MRFRIHLVAFLLCSLPGVLSPSCSPRDGGGGESPGACRGGSAGPGHEAPCKRIVSLAPSVTESLFALGLGDRVVGVTRYCRFPPAARDKAKIGGYFDPNYEAIVALRPDLVVLLAEHGQAAEDLAALGLRTLELDHQSVRGILLSLERLGRACGRRQEAERLVRGIEGEMARVRARRREGPRPRVLVVVGRAYGTGTLRDVYVAGRKSFYHRLIELAGGENACKEERIRFPAYSAEGILRLDPDLIVELIPDLEEKGLNRKTVLGDWRRSLPGMGAVKENHVALLTGDYTVIPGPRFIRTVEGLAERVRAWEEERCRR